jgi:hypothetical protein
MKKNNPLNDVPILDASMDDFKEHLEFNLWSTQSCADFRNDRDRPYDGQPWTDDGERGKAEVKGLTIRDVTDCYVKAVLLSSANDEYFKNFSDLWDFSECHTDEDKPKPTQFLLDNQHKFPYAKVELGTWRPQDLYNVDFNSIDSLAVAHNLSCEIERMMRIFPNINK